MDNCWERKDCAKDVRNQCPAYPSRGRDCWKVTGTACGQGRYRFTSIAEKIEFCRQCDFYKEFANHF